MATSLFDRLFGSVNSPAVEPVITSAPAGELRGEYPSFLGVGQVGPAPPIREVRDREHHDRADDPRFRTVMRNHRQSGNDRQPDQELQKVPDRPHRHRPDTHLFGDRELPGRVPHRPSVRATQIGGHPNCRRGRVDDGENGRQAEGWRCGYPRTAEPRPGHPRCGGDEVGRPLPTLAAPFPRCALSDQPGGSRWTGRSAVRACETWRVPAATRKGAWSRWSSRRRASFVAVWVLGLLLGTVLSFTIGAGAAGIAYGMTGLVLLLFRVMTPTHPDSR